MWSSEEGFLNLVQDGWYGSILGNRQFHVAKKLSKVKGALREWNKTLSFYLETLIV